MTQFNEDHLRAALLSTSLVWGTMIVVKLVGFVWRRWFGEGHKTILVKQFGKIGEYEIHQDNRWYGTYYHVYKWQTGGSKIAIHQWCYTLDSAVEKIVCIEAAIRKTESYFPKS